MKYAASDWYWTVDGSTTSVWSSARAAYVGVGDAEYAAWRAAGGVTTRIDSEDNLRAVLAEQYPLGWPGGDLAQRLTNGIVVTSTDNPGMSATYALDPVTLNQIGSVARDVAAGLGLPGGGDEFVYPDISGYPRTLAAANVTALYRAMRDLVFGMDQASAIKAAGGQADYPPQSATIG